MKKTAFSMILSILIGAIFAFLLIKKDEILTKKNITDFNISCDLNLQDCEFNGVLFSLNPRPVFTMTPTLLEISNLKGDFKNLNAQIYGVNMEMGTIKANFKKFGEIYRTNVVFSACVVAKMIYRIEIFDGDKSLGIFADLVMKN